MVGSDGNEGLVDEAAGAVVVSDAGSAVVGSGVASGAEVGASAGPEACSWFCD